MSFVIKLCLTMELSVLIFIETVLNIYFTTSRCLVLVNDDRNNFNLPYINIPFVNLYIDLSDNNSSEFKKLMHYFGCQDFIIYAKEPTSVFRKIEKEIKITKERFANRRFVLLPSKDVQEDSFGIFNTTEINFVSDLLVVKVSNCSEEKNQFFGEDKNCTFEIWTHHYNQLGKENYPYILDKFFSENKSFQLCANLFPEKLRYQNKRQLKFATFQYEPYIIAETVGDNSYFMGSEMMTAINFANYLNMTFVPVVNTEDYWGEVYDNWTGNGLMGNILMDYADFGAAALYTWDSVYPFLELSKPTVRTGITCLVPTPKQSAGWLTPIYAFAPATWIAVGLAFISSVFAYYLSQIISNLKYSRKHWKKRRFGVICQAFLSVFKPYVLQNVISKEMIWGSSGKFIMGLIFMTSLIISATYDSGFATVMTIPIYDNPIDTVDDFVRSGINWGAQSDAWTISISGSKEEKHKKLVARFQTLTEDQLNKKSQSEWFAFSLERLPKGDFAIGNYIQNDVIANYHLMQDDFYWEYCVMMARRNSILLPLLDDFILRVFEAGLISVWQHEAASKYMNQYVQKAVKYLLHKKERTVMQLKISHVVGAFGILVLGHSLGFLVFVLEVVTHKWKYQYASRQSNEI